MAFDNTPDTEREVDNDVNHWRPLGEIASSVINHVQRKRMEKGLAPFDIPEDSGGDDGQA